MEEPKMTMGRSGLEIERHTKVSKYSPNNGMEARKSTREMEIVW